MKFKSRTELLTTLCPDGKPFIEVWHVSEKGFGARIAQDPPRRPGEPPKAGLRVYLYRHKDEQGRDIKQRLGTFAELDYERAQDAVRQRKAAASASRGAAVDIRQQLTLQAALARYIENRRESLRPATLLQYEKVWAWLDEHDPRSPGRGLLKGQKFTERTQLHELSGEWWLAEYTRVMRRHGAASARAFYRVAHAVHAYYLRHGKIAANPLLRVSEDKRDSLKQPAAKKEIIPAAHLPALWAWLTTRAQPATRDLTLVELFSGVRASTAGQLRWSQVNIETRTYRIPAEERGNKSKTLVEVPIADELWRRVFAPRLACRAEGVDWVIPSAKQAGKPARSTRSAMLGLRAVIGLHVTPHVCRRTFASLAQQATQDPLLVARMLTHSVNARDQGNRAPLVTAGYIHYEEDVLRQALNKTAALILQHAGAVQ